MDAYICPEPRQPYCINIWTAKTLPKRYYGRGKRFQLKPIENGSLQKSIYKPFIFYFKFWLFFSKNYRKIACDLLTHCYKQRNRPFPCCLLVCLCVKTRLRAKPFVRKCVGHTGSFSCKSNSFSCDRFCRQTRFETEAQGNSRMVNSYLMFIGFFNNENTLS